MAYAVRLLLLAAVACLCRAVPCSNTAAPVSFFDDGTTVADVTRTEDTAATTPSGVTRTEDTEGTTLSSDTTGDTVANTDDPRTELPTPPQPVAFLPSEKDSSEKDGSSSSSSSEESSESSESNKTDIPESTTTEVGTEDGGEQAETTPQGDTLHDAPSDNDDVDDLFSDMKERYVAPGLKLRKHRCPGVLNGRTVGGVCLDKAECLLKRGAKAGHCGLLGSCCYFQHTCGDISHYKVSHFTSPSASSMPPECELRVNVFNRDVCQIRVDFEEFSLAQPERETTYFADPLLSGYHCLRDRFTVEAPASRNLGFPSLCGENRGQHIYIPVNATLGGMAVRLNFRLYNRTLPVNGSILSAPRWLLRITQLECAAAEYDYSSIAAALASTGYQAVNKHVLGATDADLLAPPGCLQFHPQRSGTYQSFNYHLRLPTRRYLANLHYAICFRRRAGDCGIRHTVVDDFLIDFNDRTPQTYVDRDCDTSDAQYNYTSDDYLFVPNGIYKSVSPGFAGATLGSKFCGLAVGIGDTIKSVAPGPFHVYFHSDDLTIATHIADEGFHMRYEVMSGDCRRNDPGATGSIFG